MQSSCGCPLGRDTGEVSDVEGDHDSSVRRREVEQSLVHPTIQRALLVGSPDVVVRSQCGGDPARGDVRVEEQLHSELVAGAARHDRRILPLKLCEGALVLFDRRVDFVRELGVVGEREPDVWLGHVGGCGHLVRGGVRARCCHDLPRRRVPCRSPMGGDSSRSPRNAIPGKRRVRSASSASASTTAPLVRRVRLASSLTSRSVMSDRRMLKGAAFATISTVSRKLHRNCRR